MFNAPQKTGWTPNERPKILAVDNANFALSVIKRMLRDEPYELHCTTSCAEAITLCADEKIDLIFLDIEMPEMDGYELAQIMRAGGQRAPIILITAHPMRYEKDEAAKLGIVDILVKPVQRQKLLEKIKQFT